MKKTYGHVDSNGSFIEVYHSEPFLAEAPEGLFYLGVEKGEMKSFNVHGIIEMRDRQVYKDGILFHEAKAWTPCDQTIINPR